MVEQLDEDPIEVKSRRLKIVGDLWGRAAGTEGGVNVVDAETGEVIDGIFHVEAHARVGDVTEIILHLYSTDMEFDLK